jgi:hypothetical protein
MVLNKKKEKKKKEEKIKERKKERKKHRKRGNTVDDFEERNYEKLLLIDQ